MTTPKDGDRLLWRFLHPRKNYKCENCGGDIKIGGQYARVLVFKEQAVGGWYSTARWCIPCGDKSGIKYARE